MKKYYLKPLYGFLVFGLWLTIGCSSKHEKPQIDCKTQEDYKYGYDAGHREAKNKSLGMDYSADADTYLRNANNGAGMLGDVSDCWRNGFYDGFNK